MLPPALAILALIVGLACGTGGLVLMGLAWLMIGIWAIKIYQEGIGLYWTYKNMERQFSALKIKRHTILKNILDQLGVWAEYEQEILATSAGTSQAANLLMQRFPQIQSFTFVATYMIHLGNIENEINHSLQSRIRAAAKWHELADNSLINCCVPTRDVPRDLLGHIRDPLVPGEEIRATMNEHPAR